MAQGYEVLNLKDVANDLAITIGPGVGTMNPIDPQPNTEISVTPPTSIEEHVQILESLEAESELGQLMNGTLEEVGKKVTLFAQGETGQRHIDLGVQLAEQIMTIRGLRAARIVAAVGTEGVESFVVLAPQPAVGGTPSEQLALG